MPFEDRATVDLTPEAIGPHTFEQQSFECGAVIPPETRSYFGYGYVDPPCDDAYRVRLAGGSALAVAAMLIGGRSLLVGRRQRRVVANASSKT